MRHATLRGLVRELALMVLCLGGQRAVRDHPLTPIALGRRCNDREEQVNIVLFPSAIFHSRANSSARVGRLLEDA